MTRKLNDKNDKENSGAESIVSPTHFTKSNGRHGYFAHKQRATKSTWWKTRFCFHCIFTENLKSEEEYLKMEDRWSENELTN